MPYRDEVIKAVEYLNWYFTQDDGTADENAVKAWEVLSREQKPRVLNLNEIHRGMVVWLEQYKVPEMLQVIGGSSTIDICGDGQKCFITGDYNSITPYDEDYNECWRAWTHKPTEEQRKAVKWDDEEAQT